MNEPVVPLPQPAPVHGGRERRRGRRRYILLGLLVILGIVLGAAWMARERIIAGTIDDQLALLDVPVTYQIETIEPDRQVFTDVIIGDEDAPDLTVERIVISPHIGLDGAGIASIEMVRPRLYGRLYGRLRDGKLHFGSLDQLIYTDQPPDAGFPAIDVRIEDGRALIDSDYGPLGIKLSGGGDLSGGFAGVVAVNAPKLDTAKFGAPKLDASKLDTAKPDAAKLDSGACRFSGATAYGDIALADDAITFSGPLRLARMQCTGTAIAAQNANIRADITIAQDFSHVAGKGRLQTGKIAGFDTALAGLAGRVTFGWREGEIDLDAAVEARAVRASAAHLRMLSFDGQVRVRNAYADIETRGTLKGAGMDLHAGFAPSLSALENAAQGTLIAPLAQKLRMASATQLRAADLTAEIVFRMDEDRMTLLVPTAGLHSRTGQELVAASRIMLSQGVTPSDAAMPDIEGKMRFSGNFRTAGAGLPELAGRMEGGGGTGAVFSLQMAPYVSGNARLAVPQMRITQNAAGALRFAGRIEADGPLPGGAVHALALPLKGQWSAHGGIALWPDCTAVRFEKLVLAQLSLARQSLRLCPPSGKSIVSGTGAAFRIAAGASALSLNGAVADTPLRIRSGPVGFAYPGMITARNLAVDLGMSAQNSRFALTGLTAHVRSDGALNGHFEGAEIGLAAVPLNLEDARGAWQYRDGQLRIEEAVFTLLDRDESQRFYPLRADNAQLNLIDNRIEARVQLHEPVSGRNVVNAALSHDLATASGSARLSVPGLLFDEALQPDGLTYLAQGVVANVGGVVTGGGQAEWTPDTLTSSGEFSSSSLDLAAAFGPVRGARGTVVFTDLLNMTTAPDQQIKVAAINPGIEVYDGVIGFALRDGQLLDITGATWPFMGGTIRLKPTQMNLSVEEERRYSLEVEGLEAAQFIQHFELANISANAVFDGSFPIVFDAMGNGRIETGTLTSRAPGGNLSYVGELSYEDMTPVADFAFDMLRSLDFNLMKINIEGPLTGDILSQIEIDGVKQGKDAARNLITRQLEDLPIQFNINVNAPFYKLATTLRSIYDPASVRDPRDVGLILSGNDLPGADAADDMPAEPHESTVQHRESEDMP